MRKSTTFQHLQVGFPKFSSLDKPVLVTCIFYKDNSFVSGEGDEEVNVQRGFMRCGLPILYLSGFIASPLFQGVLNFGKELSKGTLSQPCGKSPKI